MRTILPKYSKNYYAILEVPVGASLEDIRQAYHRLVQEHLDDDAAFADLKEAYEVLTTPGRRAEYDAALSGETNRTAAPGFTFSAARSIQCPMAAGPQCPVLNARVTPADTYCPECGFLLAELSETAAFDPGSLPTLQTLARLEEAGGKSHPLRSGPNVVGRESGDVLLPDKTVSRQHARLEIAEDGSARLEDLGSTNGTQINEQILSPSAPGPVKNGDRLRFGSVALVLHLPTNTAAPLSDASTPDASTPETLTSETLTLETLISAPAAVSTGAASYDLPPGAGEGPAPAQVVETREGGQIYPLLPGTTTFGRRADNSVVLTGDPYVSGSHARITSEGGDRYALTDTGSTNGTLLNGDRLPINTPAALVHGDVLLIGSVALRFEIIGRPLDDDLEEDMDADMEQGREDELEAAQKRETPLEG